MNETMTHPELAAYQRLVRLAIAQVHAIEADDLNTFNALSSERDALVEDLQPPADARARAVARHLLEQVVALDTRARTILVSGIDAVRAELGQLRRGHSAVRAYAPARDTRGIGGQA